MTIFLRFYSIRSTTVETSERARQISPVCRFVWRPFMFSKSINTENQPVFHYVCWTKKKKRRKVILQNSSLRHGSCNFSFASNRNGCPSLIQAKNAIRVSLCMRSPASVLHFNLIKDKKKNINNAKHLSQKNASRVHWSLLIFFYLYHILCNTAISAAFNFWFWYILVYIFCTGKHWRVAKKIY